MRSSSRPSLGEGRGSRARRCYSVCDRASEYLLVADIDIASERASYGDFPHPTFGLTGGDGLHVVWEEIVGTARAKWKLWTGERIEAQTALQWGVVGEVVTH